MGGAAEGPAAAAPVVASIAGSQHGVIAAAQLRVLGLDRCVVQRWVARGYLHRLHHGVFAVGHTSLSLRGRYMAAVLAGGRGAVLSHRSAADLWDLRRSSTLIEITIPRDRAVPAGLRVHRSRMLERCDVTSRDGIPVTTVARTLLDLAGVVRRRELGNAVDRAERLELFDLVPVQDLLARARGRRGVAELRRAIGAWRPRSTRSELEDRHWELVTAAGLPSPRLNVLLEGERDRHEVDAFWPAPGLVVQLDGFAYHRTRRDRERDAATDADLELRGYRVVRLTWDDVVAHGARTVRRLRLLLA